MPAMEIYEDMSKGIDRAELMFIGVGKSKQYELYAKKIILTCRDSLNNYLPLFKLSDTSEKTELILESLVFGTTDRSLTAVMAKTLELTIETEAIYDILREVSIEYGKILTAFEDGVYEIESR